MGRKIAWVSLFMLGALLASDIGLSTFRLSEAVTRNPLTIELTSFLSSNGPASLYELEQDFLLFAPISVIAVMSGLVASLILSYDRAVRGFSFWAGYAIVHACMLTYYADIESRFVTTEVLIPFVIGIFCTIPSYGVGIEVIRLARIGCLLTCSLRDMLTLTGACAILAFASIADVAWISTCVFLAIAIALYLRLHLVSRKSGEPDDAPESPS
ncbi:hypothetical protein [Stieleria neptunia]|nr:hypothetical protein [Stieleria neptunia]